MKNKICLFVFVSLFTVLSFSQHNKIVLEHLKSSQTKEIKENKRIKIKTTDGEIYYGRFKIIDEETVEIKNKAIPLDSITELTRKSLFGKIANPVFITIGTLGLIAATVGAAAGGYGFIITVISLPPSIPLVLIPAISNKHKIEKWGYSIKLE